jgi:BirA family transcriptional regulator, biotin operon repressor / biotin---[acetyl-CoA-carboxylase] ligase
MKRSSPGNTLMRLLRSADGKFLSGSRLAERMGVSRAAVHKGIERLRERGYRIVGTTRLGYRMVPSPQGLDLGKLSGRLARRFLYYKETTSTQEEAKRRALQGAPEGTVVLADRQTAGRGRLGRRWESPVGGLWFSLILRPRISPGRVAALSLVAALDWVRVIRRLTGLPTGVKWPNDVWLDGKKIAGILTEMSSETDRVHWVVLGVGLNVNNRPPKGMLVPAMSLARALGRPVSRQELLSAWLAAFSKSYAEYLRKGFDPFRRAYESRFVLKGKRVGVREGEDWSMGTAAGVDAEGRLELRSAGRKRFLSAGEIVTVRGA